MRPKIQRCHCRAADWGWGQHDHHVYAIWDIEDGEDSCLLQIFAKPRVAVRAMTASASEMVIEERFTP
jgi:hypothetical protein